jgi:hypothetical protein
MIEVYACDFSGNGVFVMFIADLLQTRRATTSKSRPGFTGIGPTHNARSALAPPSREGAPNLGLQCPRMFRP